MPSFGNVELIFQSLVWNNSAVTCLSNDTAPAPTIKSHSLKKKVESHWMIVKLVTGKQLCILSCKLLSTLCRVSQRHKKPQATYAPAARVHVCGAVCNLTPPNPFPNPLHRMVSTAVLESQHTSLIRSRMSVSRAYANSKLAMKELFITNQYFLPCFEVISLHWT